MSQTESQLDDLLQRKHPDHCIEEQFNTPVIVFVTVCTLNRVPWLATSEVHDLLIKVWSDAKAWVIGRYIIMPDHIHFFASPIATEVSLKTWIKYWKSQFSKAHQNKAHRWQSDYWDRTLRRHESYQEKWDYVVQNPQRHGLTKKPSEWPFQGELNELRWI